MRKVRRSVIKRKGLLIQGRIPTVLLNSLQYGILKRLSREGNVPRGRKNILQSFIVSKEEEFVFNDRATAVDCPLVRYRLGAADPRLIPEPVIGVEDASVVPVVRIAVELIAARLGRPVDDGTGCAPVLRAISVLHHSCFGDLS